jgi:hypothetical protein
MSPRASGYCLPPTRSLPLGTTADLGPVSYHQSFISLYHSSTKAFPTIPIFNLARRRRYRIEWMFNQSDRGKANIRHPQEGIPACNRQARGRLTDMLYLYWRCSMILSYTVLFDKKRMQHRIKATVTTNHSTSRYEQPVILLEDGGTLDASSWFSHRYRVLKASRKEISALLSMGLV